jgi:hypothetical protein
MRGTGLADVLIEILVAKLHVDKVIWRTTAQFSIVEYSNQVIIMVLNTEFLYCPVFILNGFS